MSRIALLAGLASTLALAQLVREPPLSGVPVRAGDGASYGVEAQFPFFEFATPDGGGMTPVCAGSTPSSTKGILMSFSRNSVASCTKGTDGLRLTNIADGDVVMLSANQPRVMTDGSGDAGYVSEGETTNATYYSEQFNNWTLQNSGVGNPTVTADFATSPSGTLTAERVQIPSTSGSGYSLVYRSGTAGSCPNITGLTAASIYVRSLSGNPSVDVAIYNGSSWVNQACTVSSTSWRRCYVTATMSAPTVPQLAFGNFSFANGNQARAASDIIVWGAQCESFGFPTTYVGPTTTASVMRRQDAGYFDVGGFVYGSMAANYKSPFAPTGTRTVLVAGAAATPGADRYQLYVANNATLFYYMSAGVLRATGSVASTWPAQRRVSTWADSSAGLGYVSDGSNASSVPQSSTMVTTMDRVYVGMNPTATTVNNYGIISNVCVDPSWKRCR